MGETTANTVIALDDPLQRKLRQLEEELRVTRAVLEEELRVTRAVLKEAQDDCRRHEARFIDYKVTINRLQTANAALVVEVTELKAQIKRLCGDDQTPLAFEPELRKVRVA